MDYLMGIDIGTRKFSAGIYDMNHNRVAFACQSLETIYGADETHPSWAFWLPERVWETVKAVIQSALRQIDDAANVRALAVSGIGYDGLPVDQNGNALYPIISWHCTRAERQARDFKKAFGRKEVFDITGLQVMACQSVYKMMWVRDHYPEEYEKTHKWLLEEDFVNHKLCGAWATDKTMACSTSLFDLKEQKWSNQILKQASLREDLLVGVQESGSVIGKVSKKAAEETGLSTETLVVLGGHDYMCSALAANSYRQGCVLDIVGTWEMVVAGIREPKLDWDVYNGGFHVSNQVVRKGYAVVGETVSANMIYWFRNILINRIGLDLEKDHQNVWDSLWAAAAKVAPIPHGVFFLPHCSGAAAPLPDSRSLGAFVGLNDAVETPDLVRALVEGLNFQFRDMVTSLSCALDTKISRIVCVGEDADNSFLMQNKADVAGKPIEVLGLHSSAMTGAALLAGIGLGAYKDYAEAAGGSNENRRVYEPNLSNTAIYQNGFSLYSKVYGALKEINWEIFDRFKN